MVTATALALALQSSRFQPVAPYPRLPWVKVDTRWCGGSFTDDLCRRNNLQGRVLWIDGTANLGRVSSVEKIQALLAKVKEVGFNTVVLDVKPIVGRTLYPSALTPQLTRWRQQTMPEGFDPVQVFREATKAQGLSFFVSLNAFSEGHSYAARDAGKPESQFGDAGWGYQNPSLQSVLYRATPIVRINGRRIALCPTLNPASWGEDCALFDRLPTKTNPGITYAVLSPALVVRSVDTGLPSALKAGEKVLATGLPAPRTGDQVVLDTEARFEPTSLDQDQIPLMMNPLDPQVQTRVLAFVEEVAERYHPDGLLFDDRFRFHGLDADFSESSRFQFEVAIHAKLSWPDDVYHVTLNPDLSRGIRPGKYFDAWLAWRAGRLAEFTGRVRQTLKRANPGTLFGIYAGSWYGDYAKYGSNYASTALSAGFPFLTPLYQKSGFAANLDVLITGCYYPQPTMESAMEAGKPVGRTVEAAGDVSNRVARDQCWVYAGIQIADFRGDKEALGKALQAAAASSQGVMVFDLSHELDDFWGFFANAFDRKAAAPHSRSDLLAQARSKRRGWDTKGYKERPFPILEGAPGTGF